VRDKGPPHHESKEEGIPTSQKKGFKKNGTKRKEKGISLSALVSNVLTAALKTREMRE